MTRARSVRVATGVLLWLVAAAAATAVGLLAVGTIGTGIFGTSALEPLSQSEVDSRLAGTTTPPGTTTAAPPSSAPPATTSQSPPARAVTVQSAGGTVWARCVPGGVQVVGVTPAQGFQVDSENDGVDDHPHIRFRAGEREIEVRLRCAGGQVTHTIEEKD